MKKTIASIAVIGLAFIQLNMSQPAAAESLDTIKDQQEQTKQELQSLQEKVSTVIEDVNALNETLSDIEETIADKEADIEKTEIEITEQEKVVEARMEQARDRLYSLQINEVSQNIVLTILESESISDMFNRALVIMRLTDAGNEQIEAAETEAQKLVDLKDELAAARQELEDKQEEALANKKELDGKVASLQALIQENQSELSSLAAREAKEVARIEEAARASADQEVSMSSNRQSNLKSAAPRTTQTSAPKKAESRPAVKKESKPAQSSGRTLKVEATGYSTKQPGLSTHTFMGIDLRVNSRVIAVDPSVIPLGSMVEVEGMGVYIAGDTGGAIKGNIIDIHFNTVAEALQWGRRHVTVRILD